MRYWTMPLLAPVLLLGSCDPGAAVPVQRADATADAADKTRTPAPATTAPAKTTSAKTATTKTAPVVIDPDTGVPITGVPQTQPPMTRAPRHPIVTEPRGRLAELPPIDTPAPATRRESVTGLDPYLEYNRASEILVHGAINRFARVPMTDSRTGVFVRINAQGAFPYIYLGPEQWLLFNGIDPKMTNSIEAFGSRTGNVILARKIVWNGTEYDLRNDEGVPYWNEPAIAQSPAATSGKVKR